MSDLKWNKSQGLAWTDDAEALLRYRVSQTGRRHWFVEVLRIKELTYQDGDRLYVLEDARAPHLMADQVQTQREGIAWAEAYRSVEEQFRGQHGWLRVAAAWEIVWSAQDAETTENAS